MKRLLLIALVLVVLAAGAWLWLRRDRLAVQYACYRVASAASFEEAADELASFNQYAAHSPPLRALVARFGTGNRRLDEYLVGYAYDGRASDAFRQTLSAEFAWRRDLLPLWAEHWRGRKENVDEEIGTIRRYLEALHAADPPREVTWRDILDIQAAMQITGHGELAIRLSPRNWRTRYERWIASDAKGV
jgi:hypothetical protein